MTEKQNDKNKRKGVKQLNMFIFIKSVSLIAENFVGIQFYNHFSNLIITQLRTLMKHISSQMVYFQIAADWYHWFSVPFCMHVNSTIYIREFN